MKQDPLQATFSHLLISGTIVHETGFEEMQYKLGIHTHPNTVMIVSVDRYFDLAIGKPFLWRMEIGRQVVESVSDAIKAPFMWIWIAEGVLAVLLELTLEQPFEHSLKTVTHKIARRIQKNADVQGVSLSIGSGSYYDNPYMLHYSYEEAKESMVDRFFQGNRLIFHYQKKKNTNQQWVDPLTPAERYELLARVRIGDKPGTETHIKGLMEKLAQAYQHNVDMFKSEVMDLVMGITRVVVEAGAESTTILSENAKFIQDLYTTIRYDKFAQKVCEYVGQLVEKVETMAIYDVSPVIRQAIQYMKQNLHRGIPLGEVAQICCLSLHYFSHVFKKEVGVSFVEYLNKLRLAKAVYYLEATDCSVQQVATQVGYLDENYFSRVFKKYMKTTPTEYRKAKLC